MGRTLLLQYLSAISMATEGSMSDELLHEILKSVGSLHAEVAGLRDEMIGFSAGLKVFAGQHNVMKQDLREIRAALNDMAKTSVTAGEIEAMHTDINRLDSQYVELATEVEKIKRAQA
jgi:hypothetical protein